MARGPSGSGRRRVSEFGVRRVVPFGGRKEEEKQIKVHRRTTNTHEVQAKQGMFGGLGSLIFLTQFRGETDHSG